MRHLKRWNVVLGLAAMLVVVCALPASAQEGSTTVYIPLVSSNESSSTPQNGNIPQNEEGQPWVLTVDEGHIGANGIPSTLPYEGFGYVEEGEVSAAAIQAAEAEIDLLHEELSAMGFNEEEVKEAAELARNGPTSGSSSILFSIEWRAEPTEEQRQEAQEAKYAAMEEAGVSPELIEKHKEAIRESQEDDVSASQVGGGGMGGLSCSYGGDALADFYIGDGRWKARYEGEGDPDGTVSTRWGDCQPTNGSCDYTYYFDPAPTTVLDFFGWETYENPFGGIDHVVCS